MSLLFLLLNVKSWPCQERVLISQYMYHFMTASISNFKRIKEYFLPEFEDFIFPQDNRRAEGIFTLNLLCGLFFLTIP